jgi:hypothetical protein
MTVRPWTIRSLVLAGLALTAGPAAQAADAYKGTIAADAQKVTFTHGLAWIDAKRNVSIGFYQTAPNDKERARAMENGGSNFGVFAVPNVRVDLSFKEGATRADLSSFESCHILFAEFDIGIFDWNAFAGGCGPVELNGELKPGAVVHGKLKGRGEAYPRNDGTKPTYTWDVDFTASVIAKP